MDLAPTSLPKATGAAEPYPKPMTATTSSPPPSTHKARATDNYEGAFPLVRGTGDALGVTTVDPIGYGAWYNSGRGVGMAGASEEARAGALEQRSCGAASLATMARNG